MRKLNILGAALFAAGALWAEGDPTITLQRVQQRYPWNGKVDIDYTVANVDEPMNYYVRFTVKQNNGAALTLHKFLDYSMLANASNGTFRATWDSAQEDNDYHFFDKTSKVSAQLVQSGPRKPNLPYALDRYVIVDLSKGTAATSADKYPVSTVWLSFDQATNTFNTAEYKTSKMVFRHVKAGTFTMGSKVTPGAEWLSKETEHQVTFTNDFLLGVFEVTCAQWNKIMGTTLGNAEYPACGNKGQTVTVTNVRGAKTTAFGDVASGTLCYRLSERTGLKFDLPTEAQWEYACSGGVSDQTYGPINDVAWHYENSGQAAHPVGSKLPNAWCFYDILGNAWEWCRDRVYVSPNDDLGKDPVTEPLKSIQDGRLPARGGSFNDSSSVARRSARSTNRELGGDESVQTHFGCRLSSTLYPTF